MHRLDDVKLFDERPTRTRTCPQCHGHGNVIEGYALAQGEPIESAPKAAVYASVAGSFDIFTACKEAREIAKRADRPVAFDFNDQVVVVHASDDPNQVARAWWLKAYGETPEQTRARR